MTVLKNIGYVLLGVLVTFAVFFVVVTIASAVNGVAIGTQIADWFGSIGVKAEEVAEVVDTVTNTSILI